MKKIITIIIIELKSSPETKIIYTFKKNECDNISGIKLIPDCDKIVASHMGSTTGRNFIFLHYIS